MGNSWEEDVVVVGNNAEDTGIQTDDTPVDAQIGSLVDDCQRKHGVILVEVDMALSGGADPMVERRKFPGWVVYAG